MVSMWPCKSKLVAFLKILKIWDFIWIITKIMPEKSTNDETQIITIEKDLEDS